MPNTLCEFCNMEIKTSDDLLTCSRCGKVYHKECWEVMGGCNHSQEKLNNEQTLTYFNNTQEQTDSNLIYCTHCGNKVDKNALVCPNCGVKIFDGTKINTNQQTNFSEFSKYQEPAISHNYVDMVKHVLLLIFTLGIYHCVWIYKTTEYTNQIKPGQERNVTANLLLCLFVPFYIIFWYYKTADIIEENNSNFKTLTLIFSIFIPILSSILVQDKMNKMNLNNTLIKNNFSYSNQQLSYRNEAIIIEEIKKYKELLDIGAITQEEYDIKKKEILDL